MPVIVKTLCCIIDELKEDLCHARAKAVYCDADEVFKGNEFESVFAHGLSYEQVIRAFDTYSLACEVNSRAQVQLEKLEALNVFVAEQLILVDANEGNFRKAHDRAMWREAEEQEVDIARSMNARLAVQEASAHADERISADLTMAKLEAEVNRLRLATLQLGIQMEHAVEPAVEPSAEPSVALVYEEEAGLAIKSSPAEVEVKETAPVESTVPCMGAAKAREMQAMASSIIDLAKIAALKPVPSSKQTIKAAAAAAAAAKIAKKIEARNAAKAEAVIANAVIAETRKIRAKNSSIANIAEASANSFGSSSMLILVNLFDEAALASDEAFVAMDKIARQIALDSLKVAFRYMVSKVNEIEAGRVPEGADIPQTMYLSY